MKIYCAVSGQFLTVQELVTECNDQNGTQFVAYDLDPYKDEITQEIQKSYLGTNKSLGPQTLVDAAYALDIIDSAAHSALLGVEIPEWEDWHDSISLPSCKVCGFWVELDNLSNEVCNNCLEETEDVR